MHESVLCDLNNDILQYFDLALLSDTSYPT